MIRYILIPFKLRLIYPIIHRHYVYRFMLKYGFQQLQKSNQVVVAYFNRIPNWRFVHVVNRYVRGTFFILKIDHLENVNDDMPYFVEVLLIIILTMKPTRFTTDNSQNYQCFLIRKEGNTVIWKLRNSIDSRWILGCRWRNRNMQNID